MQFIIVQGAVGVCAAVFTICAVCAVCIACIAQCVMPQVRARVRSPLLLSPIGVRIGTKVRIGV